MKQRLSRAIGRTMLAASLVLGFGVVAAGLDVSAQSDDARVRITHASPDAPAVDIWVNGQPAVTDLAFGESTGVIDLPAGSYDVAVTPAGSMDPEADAVIAATLDLMGGAGYDVFAVGYLDEISAQIYDLDLSPLAEGNTRIQVIHASPDAPAVDILANGGAAVEGLAFPDASGYLELPAGSYDLQVAVSETGDVVLDLPGTALDAGQVYVVAAIGEVADGSLTVLPLVAPADMAVGGEDAADAGMAAGGEGEMAHSVPATGIGTSTTAQSMTFMLLATAIVLMALAGATRLAPLTRRSGR